MKTVTGPSDVTAGDAVTVKRRTSVGYSPTLRATIVKVGAAKARVRFADGSTALVAYETTYTSRDYFRRSKHTHHAIMRLDSYDLWLEAQPKEVTIKTETPYKGERTRFVCINASALADLPSAIEIVKSAAAWLAAEPSRGAS